MHEEIYFNFSLFFPLKSLLKKSLNKRLVTYFMLM